MMPIYFDGELIESESQFLNMLDELSYDCRYSNLGCVHSKTCSKRRDAEQAEQCGYYKYFQYLEENF